MVRAAQIDKRSGYRLAARWGDAAGSRTEWSLACPGSGIAVDCCSLLTSVLAFDVVAAVSRVGPAGSTPKTVVLGGAAGDEFKGISALMGGGVLSVQPKLPTATETARTVAKTLSKRAGLFGFSMLDPEFFM